MVIAFCGFLKNLKLFHFSTKLSHNDNEINKIQNISIRTNSCEDATLNDNTTNKMQMQRIMDEHIQMNKGYESILQRLKKLELKIE